MSPAAPRTAGPAAGAVLALAGFDPAVRAGLAAALAEAGYRPRAVALAPRRRPPGVAALAAARPALLLLAAGADPAVLALLDALRLHPATAALPVLVLGTSAPVREQALASGNVYTVLGLPVDLDELLDAVRRALAGVPFEARVRAAPAAGAGAGGAGGAGGALARAADALDRGQRGLLLAWLQRVRGGPPHAARPALRPRDVLDHLARLVHAVAAGLRQGLPPGVLGADPDLRERARHHARLRRGQGLDAAAVGREYRLLREVLTEHLRRELAAPDLPPALRVLERLLDEAAAVTLAEFERPSPAPPTAPPPPA
jgi:RsbT co-antagonist protein rsbRD N-terminal domain